MRSHAATSHITKGGPGVHSPLQGLPAMSLYKGFWLYFLNKHTRDTVKVTD